MLLDKCFAKPGEIGERLAIDEQLIRIGASGVGNCDRLAAPDELRAARAEAPPTAKRVLSRSSIGSSVPSLHRLNGETITEMNSISVKRLRQWGRWRREQISIARKRNLKLLQVVLKGFYLMHPAEVGKGAFNHALSLISTQSLPQ